MRRGSRRTRTTERRSSRRRPATSSPKSPRRGRRRHRGRRAAGRAGGERARRRVPPLLERRGQAEAQRSGGRGGCSGGERLSAGQLGPPQAHHLSQGARDHGRRPRSTGARRRPRRHVRRGGRKGSCCVPSLFGANSPERDSVRSRRPTPGPLCGRRRGRTEDSDPRECPPRPRLIPTPASCGRRFGDRTRGAECGPRRSGGRSHAALHRSAARARRALRRRPRRRRSAASQVLARLGAAPLVVALGRGVSHTLFSPLCMYATYAGENTMYRARTRASR